jgi:hypothetical protein
MPIRARLLSATDQRIEVGVRDPGGEERTLWFSSPAPAWQGEPPTHDFIAVALAHYAAFRGVDLHVDGPVTAAQLDQLDQFLTIWSVWRPDLFRRVSITAGEEVSGRMPAEAPDGAAMAFSGGVDAGFALAVHADGRAGRLNRRVDLGVLAVGSDLRHGDTEALALAQDSARRVLESYGARLAVVSSNWRQEFCDKWFMSFNTGFMAMLHTFSATHGAGIHATDLSYRLELRLPPYGSHFGINHLLGNPSFPIISTGGTHSRLERVEYLSDHPRILESLRVCYQADAGGTNCGRCQKCIRTQLELRALGLEDAAAPAFPTTFDVEDLRSAKAGNPTVLSHFEEIVERLDPEDPIRPEVERWLRRRRPITPAEGRRLRKRLRRRRQELRTLKAGLMSGAAPRPRLRRLRVVGRTSRPPR